MKGWYKESYRHYLASKGIKTNKYFANKYFRHRTYNPGKKIDYLPEDEREKYVGFLKKKTIENLTDGGQIDEDFDYFSILKSAEEKGWINPKEAHEYLMWVDHTTGDFTKDEPWVVHKKKEVLNDRKIRGARVWEKNKIAELESEIESRKDAGEMSDDLVEKEHLLKVLKFTHDKRALK